MNFLKYQDFISTNRARTQNSNNNATNNIAPVLNDRPNCDPRNCNNINPPIVNIYDNTNDLMWVESWLMQNAIMPLPPKTHTNNMIAHVPINQAKISLKESLQILNKLIDIQNELKLNVDSMSTNAWKQKTIEIGVLKDEFTKLMAKFENPEIVNHLKVSVGKRRKKRARQKQSKLFKRKQLIESQEKRAKLHKDIDQWLASMKEEAEKVKMEENMKRDADCVLSEVTRKKSEARKQLSLISALVKLRSVREQFAAARGEKTITEDRQAFNIETEKLVTIWENSMKTYTTEEQGLRLMLEKNAEDDSKAAKLAKERKLFDEWQTVLFGPKYLIPANNPTYWALTAAERDMETFIAIRYISNI